MGGKRMAGSRQPHEADVLITADALNYNEKLLYAILNNLTTEHLDPSFVIDVSKVMNALSVSGGTLKGPILFEDPAGRPLTIDGLDPSQAKEDIDYIKKNLPFLKGEQFNVRNVLTDDVSGIWTTYVTPDENVNIAGNNITFNAPDGYDGESSLLIPSFAGVFFPWTGNTVKVSMDISAPKRTSKSITFSMHIDSLDDPGNDGLQANDSITHIINVLWVRRGIL
jgi:hypothetical protein